MMESVAASRPPLFVAQLPSEEPKSRRIDRVLIANRGEIACRVIATCRKLCITSIAIFVEEDAHSRHVSEADEAICLGSISQADSNPFLNIELLVRVSLQSRADAIHPGYGYLSENGAFADAIRQAGMIFVGPSSEAIGTLGDKRASKVYLRKHAPTVPLVPGFAGSSQKVSDLEAAAEKIGYPVMLKASAGGGGRGMRIVRQPSKLREDLERAQSEAQRSFGSSDCILEKYIESAKHIEVQIIGDKYGNVFSLLERECSVQRRHQKIIEETPSPFLTPQIRQDMCAAAVKLGELILYEGAGTVEFVVDAKDGSFYFLEVNTRLQVEHPITEEVTGLDVVALQLYVAAGGNLCDLPQLQSLEQKGHAIECRLCAEDASKGFMPETGTIRLWNEAKFVQGSRDVRYETSVESGSPISIYFDSMIAKIIVWAPTRNLAISKMVKIMANTACVGVKTNQLFLQSCLMHPSFQLPTYTTSLIPDNLETLLKNPYLTKNPETSSALAVIPALILSQLGLDEEQEQTKSFGNVRKSFRNQRWDQMGCTAVVVRMLGCSKPSAPLLCVWDDKVNALGITASIVSLEEFTPSPSPVGEKSTIEKNTTNAYLSVSRWIREGRNEQLTRHHASLRKWQKAKLLDSSAAAVEVSVNNLILHAWLSIKAKEPLSHLSRAANQSIMCHFPAIGTWFEYECYSLLSYFEKLRDSTTSSKTMAAAKTIRAPMPCKVLSVLKKDGDYVKSGEPVMVIESMKMETGISSAVDGIFHTSVAKGDTVDDGIVLCWFD